MKVGVHQGSVLSPLLFAVVMNQVSRDIRGGLPWELLFANDLVLMATSEEDLERKLFGWKNSLALKGLKVNTSKTKIMVSIPFPFCFDTNCKTVDTRGERLA